jgi:hypothetical protein
MPDEARYCFSCGSDLSGGGVATVVQPRDVTAELQDRLTHVLNGRYVVKKLLGAGGMGAVFLADDLTLERTVAIKVLRPTCRAMSAWSRAFSARPRPRPSWTIATSSPFTGSRARADCTTSS